MIPSPELLALLTQALGVRGPGRLVPDLAEISLPAPQLSAAIRERLAAAIGGEHVRDDVEARRADASGVLRECGAQLVQGASGAGQMAASRGRICATRCSTPAR